MWDNMENKVNNHPYNRNITVEVVSDEEKAIKEFSQIEHVENVYRSPGNISVMNTDGEVQSIMSISYFKNGYQPVITAGEYADEGSENSIIVPEVIHDIDPATQARVDIDCKSWIGKTLNFRDDYGNTYNLKVVGTFDTTDPALSNDCIYTTYNQLIKYSDKIKSDDDSIIYAVIVDNYRNNDYVLEQLNRHYNAYSESSLSIDLDTFNMSLAILVIVLAVFLIMVIIGTAIFITSCIKSRTNEFALYRSLGYRTNHIFTIMFFEYLLLFIIAFLLSLITSILSANYIINPYLNNTIGKGIMAMQSRISPISIFITFAIFCIIIVAVCINATKRTGRIQLTVLLKER